MWVIEVSSVWLSGEEEHPALATDVKYDTIYFVFLLAIELTFLRCKLDLIFKNNFISFYILSA